MKTTGIVRRIDELGRVVIPKELRRTMHIKEGEEMEVFVAPEDTLILKKYSAVKALSEFSGELADVIYRTLGHNCLICDTENFIACSTDKAIYLGKKISKALENFISSRKVAYLKANELFSLANEGISYKDMAISPIIYNGDVLGGFILVDKNGLGTGDAAAKIAEVGAGFLSRQL